MGDIDTPKRPSREAAHKAAAKFLALEVADGVDFQLIEDGDDGWAFWVLDDDTSSYVHPDLSIEWYGTTFDPTEAGNG